MTTLVNAYTVETMSGQLQLSIDASESKVVITSDLFPKCTD